MAENKAQKEKEEVAKKYGGGACEVGKSCCSFSG